MLDGGLGEERRGGEKRGEEERREKRGEKRENKRGGKKRLGYGREEGEGRERLQKPFAGYGYWSRFSFGFILVCLV